jgi:tetratricopeptide (TPR) repeat protein
MLSDHCDLNPAFAAATRLFQLGLLNEAEAGYRAILKEERGNADAWNMLGIVLQRQGKRQESIDALQAAMEISPRSPEILVNLGNVYKESGNPVMAVRNYRRALTLDPRHVMAHVNLASCLVDLGELDLAEEHAQQALTAGGQSLETLSALANVAEHRRDFVNALSILETAARQYPDNPDLLVHLGCTCMLAKRHEAAVSTLRRALELRPRFVEALNNLGQALFELGRLEEAEEVLQAALQMRPDMKEAYINLANVQIGQRRHAAALTSFGHVFELDPDNASAHFVCGMVHLVEGDFANGWREYGWRWQMEKYRQLVSSYSVPVWGGESLDGRTLFVHAEQGIGDTLQFARYLPLLGNYGGRVVFEVQVSLKRLMVGLDGVDIVMAQGESAPQMDMRVPLLSLPAIMKTDLGSIPAHTPYLKIDAAPAAVWRTRLDQLGSGLKVGLAWAGNPEHANDHNRSMQLDQLAPLGAVDGVRWVSLQKGIGREQIQVSQDALQLVDWTDELTDFADTAALIDGLDLVLAVDTSVVHLAGALNKPVWTMIPFAPDWRWLLDRTDTPWYPSMRLFRQSSRGDWRPVVNAVAQELHLLAKAVSSLPT